MKDYQKNFIELAIEKKALCFGEYKLKSGRISPYFFNTGLFNDGESLAKLGSFYAEAIKNSKIEFDMLYGPAYKGIPLASAAAISSHKMFEHNYQFSFNRKEIKDHGEGGIIFGAEIKNRVLIVDDVISAGTSVNESIKIIQSKGAIVAGVVVAVNRQEKGKGEFSAIQEAQKNHNIKITSIVNLNDIISYISKNSNFDNYINDIIAYRKKYGEITD